jgi:uncharacterized protein YbbK (DUF523 family)
MRSFCRRFLSGFKADGFILKARSPSCAVRDATVWDAAGRRLRKKQAGLFAAAVLARFPDRPVEDERALSSARARMRFLGRVQGEAGKRPTRKGGRR